MTEPKGEVWGGIVHFPDHPSSSMHGEVRCIIRTRLFSQVIAALSRFGIEIVARDLGRTWTVSESHVERLATENHYGEVLACPIATAYLSPSHYQPVARHLMTRNKRKRSTVNAEPK